MSVVQTWLRSLTFAETVPVFVKSACCLLCASVRSSAWCRASAVRWQSSPNFTCPAFLRISATQCNGKIKTPLYVAFHEKTVTVSSFEEPSTNCDLQLSSTGFYRKTVYGIFFPSSVAAFYFPLTLLTTPSTEMAHSIRHTQCRPMAVGGFWGALGVQSPPNPETALFSGLDSVTSIITTKTDPVFH